MNRRGFALITVLWLIAALAVFASGGLAFARTGIKASANRVMLTRAGWAREACIEIMLQRGFAANVISHRLEVAKIHGKVDLGRNAWCSLQVDDPSAGLNLNTADKESLIRLLGDSLSDAVLDWRDPDDSPRALGAESDWYRLQRRALPRNAPLASPDELRLVRGFDSSMVEQLRDVVTTRGSGVLNLNSAPPRAIGALLDLPAAVVALIVRQRAGSAHILNLDQLISLTPPNYRAAIMSRYQDLMQQVVFSPLELVVQVTGGVGQSPLIARAALTIVPVSGRVAVIRREIE